MPARIRTFAAVALAAALCACSSTSTEAGGVLRGRVVGLSDGDTITVVDAAKARHKIRLTGIDAPEKKQPFGSRSSEHLSSLVFQKEVEVRWAKRDHYGRILGKVMVADPACRREPCPRIDANLSQIEAGFAWWYRQYAKDQPPEDRRTYAAAEERSREAKRGLWADPAPVAPWKWRHPKKAGSKVEKEGRKRHAGAAP